MTCTTAQLGSDLSPFVVSVLFFPMTTPNYEELEKLFAQWWADSYPMVHPGPHTIRTHAAFAQYVLNLETLQNLR